MRLRVGEDIVTLGPQLKLKKNIFHGIVVHLNDARKMPAMLASIRAMPRMRHVQTFPHALRVRGQQDSGAPEEEETRSARKYLRPTEDKAVYEDWEDDGEAGVGDRLLHLLQRWQVENVVLLIARQDDSLSGRLIGPEVFKLMAESGKLALEEYYMDNAKPSDAAKLELLESTAGTSLTITPRDQHPTPAVCLMTSETVPSWPANHHPTSDGGGRKVAKRGRINHFLHKAVQEQDKKASAQARSTLSVTANQDAMEMLALDDDLHHQQGGVDWLGITKDEWNKLRGIRVPVKELHYLFMCLIILLDTPKEKAPKSRPVAKHEETYTPPSFSWVKCREILHRTPDWHDKLRQLRGATLTKDQVAALRSIFQEPNFTEAAFVRISVASVKIYTWLQRLLDEFDENELGLNVQASPAPVELVTVSSPRVVSPRLSPKKQPLQPHPPPQDKHENSEDGSLSHELNSLVLRHETKPKGPRIVDRGRLFGNIGHF
ncbi:TPA: hypothetical protein N0F65_008628 [Lagenidium giganteum]|uniref:Impact N-terminal domain-containing protein n=1 Tax=Lagenidium giganteum TaxID=4803 RepID=A0AAV2Z0D4_9STRA|nr:TPA: hypothetical protein N0F65_008628 [Lagenidium giganteum]